MTTATKSEVITNIREYANMREYADTIERLCSDRPELIDYVIDGGGADHFSGYTSLSSAFTMARNGDTDQNVERIEAMLDQINVASPMTETPGNWEPAMVGYVPSVPAYIAGMPCTMLQRETRPNDGGLVRVYCCIGGSASVEASDLQKRGAAIAAFVERLSMSRPVELYAVHAMGSHNKTNGNHLAIIRMGLAPMPMREISFALSHPAMTRRLGFLAAHTTWNAIECNFPQPWRATNGDTVAHKIHATLGLTSDDIVIPKAVSGDGILGDPIGWINRQLEKYRQ